jgi:hypothetical protein
MCYIYVLHQTRKEMFDWVRDQNIACQHHDRKINFSVPKQRPILNFAPRDKLRPQGRDPGGTFCPLGVKLSPGGQR